ncbi:MAG: hypothetical protein GF330_06615 [Candidatus Eisenbacteria bacterium]|nr:hypothetical protein [Candidatus Eisenbacteria bacterium]
MAGSRTIIGGLALLCAASGLGLGCGSQFELPPQPPPGRIPEPGTYNLWTVWPVSAPGDLAVYGLYLFLIEEQSRVTAYYSTRLAPEPVPMVSDFEGLEAPARIALAKRDSLFVVVADSVQMQVKIYYWLGGEPLYSFHDSLWQRFSGLAADAQLHIYVADAERDTVQAYDRWGRRLRVVTDYGTGFGYVIDPHGLAHNGEMLLVTDTGKNMIQRLEPDTSNVSALPGAIGEEEDLLLAPQDVASDRYGEYIYVADTGQHRVLKFQTTGAFQDTVYSETKIALDPPIRNPRFLTSEDAVQFYDETLGAWVDFRTVYVSDPEQERVVLFKLASQ